MPSKAKGRRCPDGHILHFLRHLLIETSTFHQISLVQLEKLARFEKSDLLEDPAQLEAGSQSDETQPEADLLVHVEDFRQHDKSQKILEQPEQPQSARKFSQ